MMQISNLLDQFLVRKKDDDTNVEDMDNMEIDSDKRNTVVVFDPTTFSQGQTGSAGSPDRSLGMSTAAKTTGTTWLKLKEMELLNKRLIEENQALQKEKEEQESHNEKSEMSIKTNHTTFSTRENLTEAQDEIEKLRAALAAQMKKTDNSPALAKQANTGTKASGTGAIT